jgi:hypothetical protein
MSSSLFGKPSGGLNKLGTDIIMRAAGAMMRGESAKDFFKTLGTLHPAFRQINPEDLENEAHRICRERGMDESEIASQIKEYLSKL